MLLVMECSWPTRSHIFKKKWCCLPQKPSTAMAPQYGMEVHELFPFCAGMWYMDVSMHEHSIYKLNPRKMVRKSREITEMWQQPMEFFEINSEGKGRRANRIRAIRTEGMVLTSQEGIHSPGIQGCKYGAARDSQPWLRQCLQHLQLELRISSTVPIPFLLL